MQGPKLSVVVVVYDMPHQIVRTIRSLSPAMQRGITADEYELLVVDNGSPEPIDRAACEAFGARIRWFDVPDATSSPAPAANLGLREAAGGIVGVLIDGARMASPGMLAHALLAARLHERPVISTLSYHLGRRPQYVSAAAGYDEAAETALLATVDWEGDGYRLFDVAVPGHAAFHWFRRPFESNAVFMPAAMWAELGGFDEGFRSDGGGLVNPDLYVRATELPGARTVSLLGEATFHQVHGGVSTNRVLAESPLEDWHEEYEELRGQRFAGAADPILCVGTPAPQ
ncbi:MAG TPA: glycosyltransferase, partial [Solirubrobacteraceae bacterium]